MLTVEINGNQTAFRPGEPIDGLAGWQLDDPPKGVEVRLFWQTAGKGTEDVSVVEAARFDGPAAVDAQTFHFTAPGGPLSYEGNLIELRWGVEVVARKVNEAARVSLVVSPDGEPVRAE
ncbi:MAG: hypothetical protein AAF800_11730 [Planctomycetota bacterium]